MIRLRVSSSHMGLSVCLIADRRKLTQRHHYTNIHFIYQTRVLVSFPIFSAVALAHWEKEIHFVKKCFLYTHYVWSFYVSKHIINNVFEAILILIIGHHSMFSGGRIKWKCLTFDGLGSSCGGHDNQNIWCYKQNWKKKSYLFLTLY